MSNRKTGDINVKRLELCAMQMAGLCDRGMVTYVIRDGNVFVCETFEAIRRDDGFRFVVRQWSGQGLPMEKVRRHSARSLVREMMESDIGCVESEEVGVIGFCEELEGLTKGMTPMRLRDINGRSREGEHIVFGNRDTPVEHMRVAQRMMETTIGLVARVAKEMR